ncbi:MAG: RNA polymerase subunit sigma-70 [Rhodospirillaceae bacterium]|nr:RNA polymerase subunit sigma-70 [Rhodospirillaceae bacterium]|tara:strand:+ start:1445 stop:2404 length:960 start_codon:yes stop_codon:yes gene_type:complete
MTALEVKKSIEDAEVFELPEPKDKHRLKVVNIADLLAMDIPPREYLLHPVIQQQGLCMVFARRGVGKTHVGLGIAYAVASGGEFLKWTATEPRRVVYIDGEMPAEAMQGRLAQIVKSSSTEPPDASYFRLITPDLQDCTMPDLSTPEGQAEIEPHIQGASLVVVDNLSTLARSGKENEGEGWLGIQGWALNLRRQGVSVLFVHHAAKGGQQRGTSRREDVLDTVLRLEHPSDYRAEDGARFEVHIDKGRGIFGDDAKSFEAKLAGNVWSFKDLDDAQYIRVVELSKDGMTVRDIAEETGISKSTVNRMQKKARADGEID